MKRSEINDLIRSASACFSDHGWTLPPTPRWDVTDFGLGNHFRWGLVLVNLAEEEEYCEKLMYAKRGMTTPAHTHHKKKEDIICRWGELAIALFSRCPIEGQVDENAPAVKFGFCGQPREVSNGTRVVLHAGERVTLVPGVWHEFAPVSVECIIGEVSTANDDLNDNVFANPRIGRFSSIEEDEAPLARLVSD